MKFDIFGRKIVEVLKEGDDWIIYILDEGKRTKTNEIVIPSHFNTDEVLIFLGDMFHEASTPEHPEIKLID